MPKQAPLRTIKRWRRYEPKENWKLIPHQTRGLYVLYKKGRAQFNVRYIGVAGLNPTGSGGIRGRMKSHVQRKRDWTHFSLFEVHDNVTADEIRELEALLLGIFGDDERIGLLNLQLGSKKLRQVRRNSQWDAIQ